MNAQKTKPDIRKDPSRYDYCRRCKAPAGAVCVAIRFPHIPRVYVHDGRYLSLGKKVSLTYGPSALAQLCKAVIEYEGLPIKSIQRIMGAKTNVLYYHLNEKYRPISWKTTSKILRALEYELRNTANYYHAVPRPSPRRQLGAARSFRISKLGNVKP